MVSSKTLRDQEHKERRCLLICRSIVQHVTPINTQNYVSR